MPEIHCTALVGIPPIYVSSILEAAGLYWIFGVISLSLMPCNLGEQKPKQSHVNNSLLVVLLLGTRATWAAHLFGTVGLLLP